MAVPALFLDRDGVINREKEYVHRIEDFEFLDGVFDACRKARTLGYKLVIITNQAGIARGFYSEEDFHGLNRWMLDQFETKGIPIDGVYFCPHHATAGIGEYRKACVCRKPEPGMILQAAADLDIDLPASVIVGDKVGDVEASARAGVGTSLLVRSGHPLDEDDLPSGVVVVEDLSGAVDWLGARNALPR